MIKVGIIALPVHRRGAVASLASIRTWSSRSYFARRGERFHHWRAARGSANNLLSFFMSEIIFLVDDAPEGVHCARFGAVHLHEADDLEGLHRQVRDAVHCHFSEGRCPAGYSSALVREEVIACEVARDLSGKDLVRLWNVPAMCHSTDWSHID